MNLKYAMYEKVKISPTSILRKISFLINSLCEKIPRKLGLEKLLPQLIPNAPVKATTRNKTWGIDSKRPAINIANAAANLAYKSSCLCNVLA